jgi:glycosyltransferase involved in cell wall biosynthesis
LSSTLGFQREKRTEALVTSKKVSVALCLPARNELPSLQHLLPEIAEVNEKWDSVDLHVVVFDDGSTDGTSSHLSEYTSLGFALSVVRSPSRVGKTPALAGAFRYARDAGADYIFMMDSDGQDDPHYLPEMLKELESGTEVVNGRRSNRKHSFFRRQSSRLFNGLVRAITGLPLLDLNSGMKGFTRSAAEYLDTYLYGELHRVLLVVASWAGFRIGEVRVVNRERTAGTTHYGLARSWRGVFDLLTLRALRRYQSRPGHLFSGIGGVFIAGGALVAVGGPVLGPAADDALLGWIGVVLLAVGIGSVLLGLGFIAELVLFLSRNPSSRIEFVVGPQREPLSGASDRGQKSANEV